RCGAGGRDRGAAPRRGRTSPGGRRRDRAHPHAGRKHGDGARQPLRSGASMTVAAPTTDAARGLSIREFFDGVREGRLVVQRCAACGTLAVPPKAVCPSCEGTAWGRATLGGDGEIASYTVIRVPPSRLTADAPYGVAFARMAEGVSLLGRLTGVAIDAVHVGMPVRFVGSLAAAEPPVIAFRPR